MVVLRAKSLKKVYGSEKASVVHPALNDLSIEVDAGEFVGVMGPSGSGKTTLLNLLAAIDKPTSGSVEINGVDPQQFNDEDLALFRRRQLGFVFQDFNLLDTLSIRENIVLPLVLENKKVSVIEQRLAEVAQWLAIESILDKRTYEVSGGQQQKVAAARAIIHEPTIILADEPTGNLDSKASRDLMDALKSLNERRQATILMVTHDPFAASFCERIVFIKDGTFFSEIRKGSGRQVFFQEILDGLSVLGGKTMNFRRLAFSNVRGHWHRYMAYYLSSSFAVMIFFIYAAFIFHPDVAAVGDLSDTYRALIRRGMIAGEVIIVIFSFFFVLYSNMAFLKARKKEFGLLALFGMTWRQVRRFVFYEHTVIAMLSIVTGIGFGVLFSKLFFMVFSVFLDQPLPFAVPPKALWLTFVSFFVLFETLTWFALLGVGRSQVIDLLQAARKPKSLPVSSKWLALGSLGCLAAGYAMAWHTGEHLLFTMLPILGLVTVGTYLLYTQGSIVILRHMRQNRHLFYKRTNVLTISQLIYKLTDNARTLFLVTMMSAVVLTATGTFYTLYQGTKDTYLHRFPHTVSWMERGLNTHEVLEPAQLERILDQQGVGIEAHDRLIGLSATITGDTNQVAYEWMEDLKPEKMIILANESFNARAEKMRGVAPLTIAEGHAVVVTPTKELRHVFYEAGSELEVQVNDGPASTLTIDEQRNGAILSVGEYLLIVSDADFAQMSAQWSDSEKMVYYGYELKNWEKTETAIQAMKDRIPEERQKDFLNRVEPYLEDKNTFAIPFFIGLFVGVVFFIAAGSILYFRLFTELTEDQAQFKALSRIGLTGREMRTITTRQVGIIFLLPFFVGVIHAAFALKTLENILVVMNVWYYGLAVAIVYFWAQLVYFWLSRKTYLQQLTKL